MRIAAGFARTILIDRSRASTPVPAAVRERRVHGATTVIPNRGRRRVSKPNSTKRAGAIDRQRFTARSATRKDRGRPRGAAERAAAMSGELRHPSRLQNAVRVVFACASTAFVVISVYYLILWLVGEH